MGSVWGWGDREEAEGPAPHSSSFLVDFGAGDTEAVQEEGPSAHDGTSENPCPRGTWGKHVKQG